MKEEFLHYIWKSKNFNHNDLLTQDGQAINILNFGQHNYDAGPDFLNASIRIGQKLWNGHVEIHIKSSDWYRHNHHEDDKYNPVILHVVLTCDREVFNQKGSSIPQLVIANKYPQNLLDRYQKLELDNAWIPCEHLISEVSHSKVNMWLQMLAIDRIEEKITLLHEKFIALNKDWEQLFFSELCRSMGLKINASAFELLAQHLPIQIIRKHKNSLLQVEALLFGQAGLLPKNSDNIRIEKWNTEYAFLKHKYDLTAIDPIHWKFLRLRPANFPTIRIAQLAYLCVNTDLYFNDLINMDNNTILNCLKQSGTSEYWNDHYVFDKKSTESKKKIGNEKLSIIVINAIVPILFYYGKSRQEEKYTNKAMDLLEQIKPESNSIIKNWKNLGVQTKSAFDTQALIHLKKKYCDQKRCLQCSIGHAILYNA